MAAFADKVSPTRVIRNILDSYPFSVGLFRELLQNSDDAKATTQTFVLDRRTHTRTGLLTPDLADTQGPALLAYNDALFEERDWDAIQQISNSRKKADTSKIGKYGLGFRSCYHITDFPQIASGTQFAIFDPHCHIFEDGGVRVEFTKRRTDCSGHLDALQSCLPGRNASDEHLGTVIRLPLRTVSAAAESELGDRAVDPDTISQLLGEFAGSEIAIALLFLRHIQSVHVVEVSDTGKTILATAVIERSAATDMGSLEEFKYQASESVVTVTGSLLTEPRKVKWLNFDLTTSMNVSAAISGRLGYDVKKSLKEKKLLPHIGLAFPLPLDDIGSLQLGRLFTFLPLPIYTGFPCHVHALFALTPDRQHLVNADESGLPERSSHRLLVEWNRFIFDTVLPRAWALAITVLTAHNQVADVFHAWPTLRPAPAHGEFAPSRALIGNLVRRVVSRDLRVWPVSCDGNGMPAFEQITELLVSTAAVTGDVVDALAGADVKVTCVPDYLLEFLKAEGLENSFLAPKSAHERLLGKKGKLSSQSASARSKILLYLLSGEDLHHIVGLPLIPATGGRHIALELSSPGGAISHTLLAKADCPVFERFDDDVIPMAQLPEILCALLDKCEEEMFNVSALSARRVHQYLETISAKLGFDLQDRSRRAVMAAARDWILCFFDWMAKSPLGATLTTEPWMKNVQVVPCIDNTVRSFSDGIFYCGGIDPGMAPTLQHLGLNLVLESLSPASFDLFSSSFLRAQNMNRLLDMANITINTVLSETDAAHLRKYLVSYLPSSAALSQSQKDKLRSFPIFRIFNIDGSLELHAIPDNRTPAGTTDGMLLPVLNDHIFIQAADIPLAQYCTDNCAVLSEYDILRLALAHFQEQTLDMQLAILSRMRERANELPQVAFDALRATPIVVSRKTGIMLAPADVVDPECILAQLLLPDDARWPDLSEPHRRALVEELRALGVLNSQLSADIIDERIRFSTNESYPTDARHALACRIISSIDSAGVDCSELTVKRDLCWLPALGGGICTSSTCFDASDLGSELFDLVASALAVKSSLSLRRFLGWDRPVPFDILFEQFAATIRSFDGPDRSRRLGGLLSELGRRKAELTAAQVEKLEQQTSDQAWIPISASITLRTEHAVFSCQFPATAGLPFREIPLNIVEQDGVEALLKQMGCQDRPSVASLVSALCSLPATDARPKQAVLILESLVDAQLTADDEARLLVPVSSGELHPKRNVYYSDRAHDADLVPPPDCFPAHGDIKQDDARKLGIVFLSSLQLNVFDNEDEDMKEELTTRISSVLTQYTEDQAFLELLANAADAGATDMHLLLDEKLSPATSILSPAMAYLQSCPSLIIHNNAVFKDADFSGIRKIGQGGKENDPNTIGKFGLGALSMFHFTDVAIVVSNGSVLFLDPSKEHLTGDRKRHSLKIPLATAIRMYPSHLSGLDGLFGFSLSSDVYQGTIFKLPLRSDHSLLGPGMSDVIRSATSMQNLLETSFWDLAQQSLFFTAVQSISARRRAANGQISALWAVSASRKDDPVNCAETSRFETTLTITSQLQCNSQDLQSSETADWHLSTQKFGRDELPEEFRSLVKIHHLPNEFKVTLATPLDSRLLESKERQSHRLFTALPLPTTIALPVHVDCPFILAPDRRTIRFDDSGQHNPESRYNKWLLSDKVAALYCNLLSMLPGNDRHHWWPGANGAHLDPLARVVVDHFYKEHMPKSNRPICWDASDAQISPSEAVFYVNEFKKENPAVITLLRHVFRSKRLVKIPAGAEDLAKSGGVQTVDAAFLKESVKSNRHLLASAYQSKLISSSELSQVVKFLLKDGVDEDTLYGLPLLPLSDRSLCTFDRLSPMIYVKQPPPKRLFPGDRFVDPDFSAEIDLKDLATKAINLSALTGQAVQELIRDRIPEGAAADLSPDDQKWVADLWIDLDLLTARDDPTDVSAFPLVPTRQKGRYVSVQEVQSHRVLMGPPRARRSLLPIFEKWELPCVNVDLKRSPGSLKRKLESRKFDFESFLRCLHSQSHSSDGITSLFARINEGERDIFSLWARDSLETRTTEWPADLLLIAQSLPVWLAPRGPRAARVHQAASGIRMLPEGVSHDSVVRFLRHGRADFIEHSTTLRALKTPVMTTAELRDACVIPRTINPTFMPDFRKLLVMIIANHGQDGRKPSVPNGRRVLEKVSNLYARSQPLFSMSFALHTQNFIHEDLADLEEGLVQFGLRKDMDLDSFKKCVAAVGAGRGVESVTQFSRLFQWYAEDLPVLISSRDYLWRGIDGLRFIPADPTRRRSAGWAERYAKRLPNPNLLSPVEVVRPALEAVAWSQRGLFLQAPHDRVLLADMSLGVPTASEVVDHLRVLALEVAVDHPGNVSVLSDLKATYLWLQDNIQEAGQRLLDFHEEPLFLNVDDPNGNMAWEFTPANELLYNVSDDYPGKVKDFLSQFRTLLLAAGARQVQRPPVQAFTATSADIQLSDLRRVFNELRESGQLTDIQFITEKDEKLFAHRVFLAACAEHFRHWFCGGFQEGEGASTNEPIEIQLDHSCPGHEDFLYSGALPGSLQWDEALELLALSNEWGISDLNVRVQTLLMASATLRNFTSAGPCIAPKREDSVAVLLRLRGSERGAIVRINRMWRTLRSSIARPDLRSCPEVRVGSERY